MNESQSGTFSLVGSTVCPSCGSVTHTHAETAPSKVSGITYVILGWLFTFISVLFVPVLFGAIAFCMGLMTYSERSKTHGTILMSFASVGLIFGSFISFMVSGTMFF